MWTRIRMEMRRFSLYALGGAVLTAVVGVIAPGLSVSLQGAAWGPVLLTIVGGAALIFSSEHSHQRIGWLLAQPVSHGALWREKMLILVLYLGLFFILAIVAGIASEILRYGLEGSDYSLAFNFVSVMPGLPGSPHHLPGLYSFKSKEFPFIQAMESIYGPVMGSLFGFFSAWISRFFYEPILLLNGIENGKLIILPGALAQMFFHLAPFIPAIVLLLWIISMGGFWFGLILRRAHVAFWAALVAPVLGWMIFQIIIGMTISTNYGAIFEVWVAVWGIVAVVGSYVGLKRLEV